MAINPLDRVNLVAAVDPQGMLACTEDFPHHWRDAMKRAGEFSLPSFPAVDRIVICGMGGSAIGGDLLRSYLQYECPVPVEVVRHYRLPGYVGPSTLVIASSYSGNTEESLSAFAEAKERGAQRFALSTGGRLAGICETERIGCFPQVPGFSPRAALAYSFVPLLVFFERWGFVSSRQTPLNEAAEVLEAGVKSYGFARTTGRNAAKKLAAKIKGKLPIIYAGQDHGFPIAQRWQCQINENAKTFAHANVVPEMNHNEILAWDAPKSIISKCHILFLHDRDDHPQIVRRFEVMASIIKKKVDGVTRIHSIGESCLARLFSLVQLGDFVSVYLALLQKHDPTPIPAIDILKKKLAQS